MIKISASTHPAKQNYFEYIKELEKAQIDMIHCDIMDGVFVTDRAFSSDDVAKINANSTIVLDVHLMVKNPYKQILAYPRAGANILTVHYEVFSSEKELLKTLALIKDRHMLVGLSIKPSTNIETIKHLLPYLDLVLIMSVEPGQSGQEFMPSSLEKIKKLKSIIKENKYNILISVDGGINLNNAKSVTESGADILVVGTALFNSQDKAQTIQKLKE